MKFSFSPESARLRSALLVLAGLVFVFHPPFLFASSFSQERGNQEKSEKLQAILEHFHFPESLLGNIPDSEIEDHSDRQSLQGLAAILAWVDPQGGLGRWARWDSRNFSLFRASDTWQPEEFRLRLIQGAGKGAQIEPFHLHLQKAAENGPARPLAGLRIALDPGHMGGERWDILTGKYVRDRSSGVWLSEGVLNLQTALLLEREFQRLGAEVFITHRGLTPVTTVPFESFDLFPIALEQVEEATLRPWFQRLLVEGPPVPELFEAVEKDPTFRKFFSESNRSKYFIINADLDARVKAIEAFRPDITLIIHFDTSDPPGDSTGVNPAGHDGTKAYVTGGYLPTELSSRAQRRYFVRHLLNPQEWVSSLQLGAAIVRQLHDNLGLPFEKGGGGDSVDVQPGVFSRNLNIPRKLGHSAVSYLESLFYNDPREFAALTRMNHALTIDGRKMPYSDRLAEVVNAIRAGVLEFVHDYGRRGDPVSRMFLFD